MVPSTVSAELVGAAGFDYVCVDCQHGLIGYDALVPMLQVLGHFPLTPVVRVPSNDGAWIGKALDAGAGGVIVPMVNSRPEAEAAVVACRYPPDGVRSFGPVRPVPTEEPLCLVMIETAAALAVASDICATPGLDGVYIGPADLSLSLGLAPALRHDAPEHVSALTTIRVACEQGGIAPGIHAASGTQARERADEGFRFVTAATDAALLAAGARREAGAARATGDPARTGVYT